MWKNSFLKVFWLKMKTQKEFLLNHIFKKAKFGHAITV